MKNQNSHVRRLLVAVVGITLATVQYSAGQGISSGETMYRDKQIFKLKAWTTITNKERRAVIYEFTDFQEGRITMREGSSPDRPSKLNLNIHKSQIEYITDKGDTIAVEKPREIKTVTIGEHLFYNRYPKVGYVEKINQTKVALGIQQHIVVMMESGTGERFKGSDWDTPTSRYDRLFTRDDEYFFIDQSDKLEKATQPALLKIFHDSKKEVKQFIKTSKINFKVKTDLLKILEFCDKLK